MDDVMNDAGTSRRLREWLHDTAGELPDDPALLGRIRSSIPAAHPRRRPSLPWRSLRLVTASVAAVSVVVVAGLVLRAPHESGVGGAVASPSPSALPLPVGSVPPGRYGFGPDVAPLMARYDVSLDVPAGWSNDNGGWVLAKQDGDPPGGATVEVDIIDRIHVDPCHPEAGMVDIPSDASPESFAAILGSWGSETGGRTSTSPTTTEPVFGTYDGRPGVELTVLTPTDIVEASCTDGHYTLWGDDLGGRWIQGPGESFRVRAIQVGSELLFLVTGSFPGTPAEVLAEQQAMLDSVRVTEASTADGPRDAWAAAEAVTAVNMPAPVADGCPIESPDGLSLYLASTRGGGPQDIYVSHRESLDDPWSEPVSLGAPVNSPALDFCPTPLADGRLLFVSSRERPAECGPAVESEVPAGDIYLTAWEPSSESYGEPMHLGCLETGTGPNAAGAEFSPSWVETADGAWLFFSGVGPGGTQDIMVSTLGPDGVLGAPEVVTELSTDAQDMMPNVSADGLEMVFNTNREGSEGQDVWTSVRASVSDPWAAPLRLGSNVNTAGNEQRATLSGDGLRLHFGRDGDIYVSTRER